MKHDLEPGEAGPVFYDRGSFYVPEDEGVPKGKMIGEIQALEDGGYCAFGYWSNEIVQLGEHENFDDALDAFIHHRIKNRTETARPLPVKIKQLMRKRQQMRAWHVCLFCGLHAETVKRMVLAEQEFFVDPDCLEQVQKLELEKLLVMLQQRPRAVRS